MSTLSARLRCAALLAALGLIVAGCGVPQDSDQGTAPRPEVPERIDLSDDLDQIATTIGTIGSPQSGVAEAMAAKAARVEAERVEAERVEAERVAAEEAARQAAEEAAAQKPPTSGGGSGNGNGSGGGTGGGTGGGPGGPGCAPHCAPKPTPGPPVEGGGDLPGCSTGASPCIPD